MKVINIEKKENNMLTCQVVIETERFETAVNKAYLANKKNITVPGFRKGKAPRAVIENMYGKQFFQQEAVETLGNAIMMAIVGDPAIEPVDDPMIMAVSEDEEGNGIVDCEVCVFPTAKLGQYKGLEITREAVVVSEDEIEAEIDKLRQRASCLETVERPAEMGDTCIIDFVGYLDGVAFPGGKGDNYSLVLGSKSFIPGFEEQLVGMSAGEVKDIEVTFPETYHVADLAGRPSTFNVTCREVKEERLAVLDDEFVRDVSEFNTVAELRAEQRTKIETRERSRIYTDFSNELLDMAANNMTDYEIPEVMIESRLQAVSDTCKRNSGAAGIEDEAFCNYLRMTVDQYYATLRPVAVAQAKIDILLHQVAVEEGINVDLDSLETGYAQYAKDNLVSEEYMRDMLSPAKMRRELITKQAKEIIENSAIVTEVTKDEKDAERAADRMRLREEYEAKQEAEKAAKEAAKAEAAEQAE